MGDLSMLLIGILAGTFGLIAGVALRDYEDARQEKKRNDEKEA